MLIESSSHLVSVVMSVYDGDKSECLKRAIDSILEQIYSNIEFVVVSDGIKNQSLLGILEYYSELDRRIRLVRLSVNQGLAHALNNAISLSTGALIVRMDADDISPPERIERLVSFMSNNPDVDAAGSYILEFSDEHNISAGNVVRYPCVHEEMRNCFLRRNPLAHASAIFRRSFFEMAGSYQLFSVRNEDTLLWLNGFKAGCRFANLPDILYYVRHDRESAGRRVGFRKSFSDCIDRIRVIIDLGGGGTDYMVAVAMLCMQNLPRSVYLFVRSLLIHKEI